MQTHDIHQGANLQEPTFTTRTRCINCGSAQLQSVWHDRFSAEPTQSFIRRCFYSADVTALLGNQDFTMARCQQCGMTFHQKVMTQDWLTILYSQWIDDQQIQRFEAEHEYEANATGRRFRNAQLMVKHLLRLHELLKPEGTGVLNLLDYGCGDGLFIQLAHSFGFNAYGIDFSDTRAQRTEDKGISIYGSLEDLDRTKTDRFHVVTLFQVLEHLPDPAQVLTDLAKRMHPEGILIVEVPNCEGIDQPKDFTQFHFVQPLEHINAFTPDTLKDMAVRAGFIPIAQPRVHVATGMKQVLRSQAGQLLAKETTKCYFRRL